MTRATYIGGGLVLLAGMLLFGFDTVNPNPLRWSALATFVLLTLAWRGFPPFTRVTVGVLLIGAYAGASLLWSPDWREGILRLQNFYLVSAVVLFAAHADREQLERYVPWLAIAGIAASIIISWTHPGTFGGLGNMNFQAEFLCILAPLALMARNPAGVIAAIAAGVALVFNASDAKYVALAAVVAAFLLPRRPILLLGLAGAVAAVVWFVPEVRYSVLYRLEFIVNTLLMWADAPWFGVGLGGYNYTYTYYAERHIDWLHATPDASNIHEVTNYIGAAHNEFVQALATFGVVGVALIAWALKDLRARNQFAFYSLCAGLGLACVGFPFQNPATAIPLALACALCLPPSPERLRGSTTVSGLANIISRRPAIGHR